MRRQSPIQLTDLAGWGAVWLLAAAAVTAQQDALRFDRLTIENGLTGPEVFEIHQDRQGFMWFGTSEALERYDGYEIKVYKHNPRDPGSLIGNEIRAITSNRDGELWIGTGTGLDRFQRDDETFVHHQHDPEDPTSLSHNGILTLFEDRDGVFWVGTVHGLNRRDRDARTFTRYLSDPDDPEGLQGDAVLSLQQSRPTGDHPGDLWVGTNAGLNLYQPSTDTFRSIHLDSGEGDPQHQGAVQAIREDAAGRLWLGTNQGLVRFDPGSGETRRFRHDPSDPHSLSSDTVRELWIDHHGTLWTGTQGGLNRLPRDHTAFQRYNHDPADPRSLSSGDVFSLFEDRSGVLWIGTENGASRWHQGRGAFTTYRRESGREPTLGHSDIWTVIESQDGALWVALGPHGLDRMDRKASTIDHFVHDPDDPSSLPSGPIANVYEDRTGELWVGAWEGGLARLDRESGDFVHYRHDPDDPRSLSHNDIHRVFEDTAGRFWVGTGQGLCRLDRASGRFTRYPNRPGDPDSLGDADFIAMVEDSAGSVWLGSLSHGLFRLETDPAGDEHFEHLWQQDAGAGAPSKVVISLLAGRRGFLWVGTPHGLLRWQPELEELVSYHEQDGLPGSTVRGILQDAAGHLWISTHLGLSRFDPDTETFRNYDVEDGLQSNAFSTKGEFLSPSGEMFFGGWRGLTAFFPDRIVDDPHPPAVALTDFRLFNQSQLSRDRDPASPLERSILESREVVLNHRQSDFGLEFAALHFAAPSKNRYRYRLEGLDDGWIDTDADHRSVHYNSLPPGRYDFRVRASNKDGLWNEQGASFRITVLPPPWRSWWAYTLYALMVAGMILGYVSWQQRQVRQEREIAARERTVSQRLLAVDKLKDEFLANTSHELRTPLYGMTGLAESLIDGVTGELPEATTANLEMIVASGRRLSHLVNDILDFSKLRHQSLDLRRRPVELRALTEIVLTLSRSLVGDKQVALVNAVPNDLPAADADENRLQQVLFNLVGNAIKFTAAGSVEVSASELTPGRLTVRVADTGIGIPEDQKRKIFDAFEQADASTEREFGGTGLGLAVTRQLVELHGGQIEVESQPEQGSTFSFTLPISSQDPTAVAANPTTPEASLGAAPSPALVTPTTVKLGAKGPHILVVDDEPVNRQVLKNYLSLQDFRLTTAASGDEALGLLEEQTFDLVLLDVMMPRLSGYEVCRILRESHRLEELPVIFLTAKNQAVDIVAGLELGANDYLTKPISRDELLARIRPHLDLLQVHHDLENLVVEKMSQVKVLRGMLPICASCKKIRDDEGYWKEVETFIGKHSEAEFTHGICPDCVERYHQQHISNV